MTHAQPADEPAPQPADVVDRPVLRLSGPAEIVQIVPYVLGFHPHESLVLMAMRGRRVVASVRSDLDAPVEMVVPWLSAATKVGASRVVAAIYTAGITGQPLPRREYVDQLGELLSARELTEVDVIAVSEGRWWSYRCSNPRCCPLDGTPIDSAGTAAATAVAEGLVALPSRESLERELAVDELAVNLVAAQVEAVLWSQGEALWVPDVVARARRWALVRRFVSGARKSSTVTPEQAANVLVALHDRPVRDAAMGYLVQPPDDSVRAAWRRLTQMAPVEWRAAPATLFALWSYAGGSGARANIGIDVALASDPDYTMARLLLELQSSGLNPFEVVHDLAREAALVGRRIKRRKDPSGHPEPMPSGR